MDYAGLNTIAVFAKLSY